VLLREIPEDENLRQRWNALVERVDQPQVFYTYEWALAVQRAYHASLRTLLFLAYDERGALCGIAALAADNVGRSVSFLCATTGDYCDFLSLPEHKAALVETVLEELWKQGIDDLTLTNLPADSDTVAALRNASSQTGYRCFARTAYICAQVSVSKLERRPGENRPVLPGKKMLRRSLNALGRDAPVRLDHARTWEEVSPILAQFMRAHVARFLATGRVSNMVQRERRQFLEELAKLLAESGWLVLTRMMSGENIRAWNYGFQFHGAWFWYQPTFDSDLEKYSPGFCLLAKLIEESADDSAVTTVDLGLGAEEYKERFANQTRKTLYVTLRSSAVRHAREILRFRAAEIVKSSPRMEEAIRAAVIHIRDWREHVGRDGLAATLRRRATRAVAFFWSKEEIVCFEWVGRGPAGSSAKLEPIGLSELASAAEQGVDDKRTLAYLLRSASRLRGRSAEGFGLVDARGVFLGFGWVTVFDRFFPELKAKVDAASADCMVIFECVPAVSASHDTCDSETISRIAERMQEQGKKPWTYGAASNIPLVQHLQKAGFQARYSLVRRRIMGRQTIKRKMPGLDYAPPRKISEHV
jgi:CelD/BcsL family acetyltransferase involved in cellulose biosynthesis